MERRPSVLGGREVLLRWDWLCDTPVLSYLYPCADPQLLLPPSHLFSLSSLRIEILLSPLVRQPFCTTQRNDSYLRLHINLFALVSVWMISLSNWILLGIYYSFRFSPASRMTTPLSYPHRLNFSYTGSWQLHVRGTELSHTHLHIQELWHVARGHLPQVVTYNHHYLKCM